MSMKRYTLISVLAFFALQACIDDAEYVAPDELGTNERIFIVDADAGEVPVDVYANRSGHLEILGEPDWISVENPSFDSDRTIVFRYGKNDGFPRRADVLLRTDTRSDTVSICQKGMEERFLFRESAAIVYNGGVKAEVAVDINVPLRSVDVDIRYLDGDGWIRQYGVEDRRVWIIADDNDDPANPRRAQMMLRWKNGWGEEISRTLSFIQARSDNHVGDPYSFSQLRALASETAAPLPDNVFIEGYVVSETTYGNAGEVEVQDVGVIDYDSNDVTVYLESLDGKYGLRLLTVSAEDNIFVRNSKVSLLLDGAMISRSADSPFRYTVSNVTSLMLVASSDASDMIPVKEKYISELSEEDIYTYVTLKDCEFPVRKGPLTPLNEGYTTLYKYNFISKYPLLVRDIRGESLYMYTNTTCTYRRDGSRLPYGSGKISGIIVHEPYPEFDGRGDCSIGDFQIRHISRSDIALNDSFSDSFSGLITEFRYLRTPDIAGSTSLPGAIVATAGNGELTNTYSADYQVNGQHIRTKNFAQSFFCLGPCGKDAAGNADSGAGIILDDGTDYMPSRGDSNSDGKGGASIACNLSWGARYWWGTSSGRGYCWLVKFSTLGISSDKVSMQFAMYNNTGNFVSPRYWKAQYSTETSDCSAASDGKWNDIGEFVVPDVVKWGLVQLWQSAGTRAYNFPLPQEILGKENVFIRLMPVSTKATGPDGLTYDGGETVNGSALNTMDYFAVRYNK